MRVFTARFLLGSLVIATVCVIVSPAEAGPFRRRGARGAAACCPGEAYGYGTGYAAAYPSGYGHGGAGYSYATPCCPDSRMAYGRMGYGSASYYQPGQVYGAGGYYQPGNLIPAGGVPMPLPGIGSSGDAVPSSVEKAKITDGAFEPPTITIKPGTAVRWTNDGEKPHTVTAVKGDWDSGDIPPGRDFTATFTKPGTFEYYCRHHKNMKGTIVVK